MRCVRNVVVLFQKMSPSLSQTFSICNIRIRDYEYSPYKKNRKTKPLGWYPVYSKFIWYPGWLYVFVRFVLVRFLNVQLMSTATALDAVYTCVLRSNLMKFRRHHQTHTHPNYSILILCEALFLHRMLISSGEIARVC